MYNGCTNALMKLSDWMQHKGVDDATMGQMVDANRVTISRIRRGINQPSWELAGRIKDATKGDVTANDFLVEAAE